MLCPSAPPPPPLLRRFGGEADPATRVPDGESRVAGVGASMQARGSNPWAVPSSRPGWWRLRGAAARAAPVRESERRVGESHGARPCGHACCGGTIRSSPPAKPASAPLTGPPDRFW